MVRDMEPISFQRGRFQEFATQRQLVHAEVIAIANQVP
jgi:hypothetical protein